MIPQGTSNADSARVHLYSMANCTQTAPIMKAAIMIMWRYFDGIAKQYIINLELSNGVIR